MGCLLFYCQLCLLSSEMNSVGTCSAYSHLPLPLALQGLWARASPADVWATLSMVGTLGLLSYYFSHSSFPLAPVRNLEICLPIMFSTTLDTKKYTHKTDFQIFFSGLIWIWTEWTYPSSLGNNQSKQELLVWKLNPYSLYSTHYNSCIPTTWLLLFIF